MKIFNLEIKPFSFTMADIKRLNAIESSEGYQQASKALMQLSMDAREFNRKNKIPRAAKLKADAFKKKNDEYELAYATYQAQEQGYNHLLKIEAKDKISYIPVKDLKAYKAEYDSEAITILEEHKLGKNTDASYANLETLSAEVDALEALIDETIAQKEDKALFKAIELTQDVKAQKNVIAELYMPFVHQWLVDNGYFQGTFEELQNSAGSAIDEEAINNFINMGKRQSALEG